MAYLTGQKRANKFSFRVCIYTLIYLTMRETCAFHKCLPLYLSFYREKKSIQYLRVQIFETYAFGYKKSTKSRDLVM